MNEIIRNYDFMMTDEEQEQYICPLIMEGYIDTTKSQIRKAEINQVISTAAYWTKQGIDAIYLMLVGAVITTGAISIIAKIVGFSI